MTLYMPLFRACSTLRRLTLLHAHLIVTGLQKDPLASTKLIESYSLMGSIQSSRIIFFDFQHPDSYMWGVFIKCHVWNGLFQEALFIYQNMLYNLDGLNSFMFPSVLKACIGVIDLKMGEKVHAKIVTLGFDSDPVIETSLLNMYSDIGELCSARKVFDEMFIRDVVSWSSIIYSYVKKGEGSEGLEMFREMLKESVEIDSVTLLSVAEAAGELGLYRIGKSVHCYIVRRSIGHCLEALCSSLVAMYGKFGDVWSAESLFYNGVYETVYSWTALISCYNQNGCYAKSFNMFIEMQESNVEANSVTLMNVVCSCARLEWLKEGMSVHGYVIRKHIDIEKDFLRSSLIDFYANCGKINYSRQIFYRAEEKHLVSWNILMSGYVREQMAGEALSLFSHMLAQGVPPDSFSLSSALAACGIVGIFEIGCQIHCYAMKTCLKTEFVENALIDMYAKCGFIMLAYRVFHDAKQRNPLVWNCMMSGFSQNGYSNEVISLFIEMYAKFLDIDEITFLSAIQACSNAGFINQGKWIHHKLITFGIKKDMQIYTALTNMYARCGDLQMAQRVFDDMTEQSVVSWSTMIGGYAMHGHLNNSISLFNKMVILGIEPNDITFMNLMSACSHSGCVKGGKFYLNSMIRDFGIEPNSDHFACLIDLLSRAGDLNGAYDILKAMPLPPSLNVWGTLLNGCRIHQRMDILTRIQTDLVNLQVDDSGYFTLLSNVYAGGGKWNEFMSVRSQMRSMGLKVLGYSRIEIE